MGIAAAVAAYSQGAEWFDQVKDYIWQNIVFAQKYIQEHCPKIKVIVPDGTYLLWLDFSAFGLSAEEIDDRILHKAKVWLDGGFMFGKEGAQFQRINCATPRSILEAALERICREF